MRPSVPILAGLTAQVFLSAACEQPTSLPTSGRFTIHLTDAPGAIQEAMVTITQVYLQGTGGRTVLRSTPYSVDLVSLATTSTVLLEDVTVPAGTYDELRFVVTGAYIKVEEAGGNTRIFASAPDYPALPPGAVVGGALRLPSFATSGLKVVLPDGGLTVPVNETMSLLVDFDVAESFGHEAGHSGAWVMHPVIRATDVTQGSTLTVTLALGAGATLPAGVTLGDFRAALAAASAPQRVLATAAFSDQDADGSYEAALGLVPPGPYLVDLVVPGTVSGVSVAPAVPVAYTAVAGPGTTLALTLTGVTAGGGVTIASVTSGSLSLHTCALTPGGAAYCWGNNSDGRLGDGTTVNRLMPTPVAMPAGVTFTSMTTGSHTCGLTPTGAVYCWGDNATGQLGDGTTSDRLIPTAVASPAGVTFTRITASISHSCGLTAAGTAYCWGDNAAGRLGDGTTDDRLIPTAVAMPAAVTFQSLTAGGFHTCGLTAAGAAFCWGFNSDGRLGDGTTDNRLIATAVAMPAGVTFASISAGRFHTCGLTAAGAAYCWGSNLTGQLGDGTTVTRLTPTTVALPTGITFVSITAGSHTCGVTSAGLGYCWGENLRGQLGDGTTANRSIPTAVAMPTGVAFASTTASLAHTCAMTPSAEPYCWGFNADGRLGDGTIIQRLVPTAVLMPTGVTFVRIAALRPPMRDAPSWGGVLLGLQRRWETWRRPLTG